LNCGHKNDETPISFDKRHLFATNLCHTGEMSRPPKTPGVTFEDAMTVHVLRAVGVTYSDLCQLLGEHSSRVTQILDGDLHKGSWDVALQTLARGDYWHPRIVELVGKYGGNALLIAATKAADPASRRHQQVLKRLRKITIPFSPRAGRLMARRA
jgi:hypothetical protein